MRRFTKLALIAFSVFWLSACSDEQEANKPKMDYINVVNNSSTEAQVRIKMWQKDFVKVTSGKEERVEFVADPMTVQVEVKSRKKWDNCWLSMRKTQTLEVFNDGERIGCRLGD